MEKVQMEINKQAEILADLNMQLSKYIESNQGISFQIVKLQDRVNKKKKQIEQETKDKSIIHEKLIKAQHKVEQLQAKQTKISEVEAKIETAVVENEIKRPEFLNKPPKTQGKEVNQQINNFNYSNAQKGDYQPPALFLDGDNDGDNDEDSDGEDNDDVLQSVRQKLENLGDEEQDDQEEEKKQEEEQEK